MFNHFRREHTVKKKSWNIFRICATSVFFLLSTQFNTVYGLNVAVFFIQTTINLNSFMIERYGLRLWASFIRLIKCSWIEQQRIISWKKKKIKKRHHLDLVEDKRQFLEDKRWYTRGKKKRERAWWRTFSMLFFGIVFSSFLISIIWIHFPNYETHTLT